MTHRPAPFNAAGRKTSLTVPFVDPPTIERRLAQLAVAQFGPFTLEQIIEAGLTASGVRKRVQRGALHRVHQGVYSLVPPRLLSRNGRFMAAVLACGPGAALSHHSAGALRHLIVSNRSRVDVTVPSRGGRARAGIQIHRSSTLRPDDIELVEGIPCTTFARTAFDLADAFPQRRIERMLDQAVAEEQFDMITLDEQLRHNRGRKRAGAKLTRALTGHRPGSTPTDGEIGERMLAIIRRAGLPDPQAQAWIDLHDGEPMIRADFAWREAMVILETDGQRFHGQPRRTAADYRRDQRAARAGWH